MRKVIVTEFLTLDGVMEEPGDWHFPTFLNDMSAQQRKTEEVIKTGGLLMGRVTYNIMAGAWPDRGRDMAGQPEPTDTEDEEYFTDRFNWLPKYVVSDSLTEDDVKAWNNSTILRGDDLKARIEALKEEDGGDIYIHGSGKLVESLLPLGVIDEIHCMIHPVTVGKGQRLFPEGLPEQHYAVKDVVPHDTGIVTIVYAPTEKPDMPEMPEEE